MKNVVGREKAFQELGLGVLRGVETGNGMLAVQDPNT